MLKQQTSPLFQARLIQCSFQPAEGPGGKETVCQKVAALQLVGGMP